MWEALLRQNSPSAYGTVRETEFKQQYERHEVQSVGFAAAILHTAARCDES
jgi:hypothetical protein